MQQLQADVLACEMAAQLLNAAPDPEAKLYYSTMVQDESRHTEAWLKLIGQIGGEGERDPHLDKLGHMFLEADTLEEKVFLMQVFFERLIIPRFRLIARSSRGTILEDICNRLAIDDGIHHGAGMAYERVLLEDGRQEGEAPADRRGEPDAPGVRGARALAAEGARVHRQPDGGARPRASEDRAEPRRAAREEPRPRRLGRRASVLAEAAGRRDRPARARGGNGATRYRSPPRSKCARKKFSEPAVAIAADALISSASAAAATICAKR